MTTHERSADVAAPPQQVYDYLADVANLPEYLPRMTEAHETGAQQVEVTAELDLPDEPGSREVQGEAHFVTDPGRRVVRWGSEGDTDYGGQMDVTGDGPDTCTVTVRLHWHHGDPEHVDADLERAVERIKSLVEQREVAS